jgi:hypothetical protein
MSENSHAGSIVLELTDGAVRNKNLEFRWQQGFFPFDAFGGPTKYELGRSITLHFDGTDETVETDITKWLFRCRAEVGRFFSFHAITGGDRVRVARIGDREYRVEPVRA